MTGPRHRLDPTELTGPDADASDVEVADALRAARTLEASIPSIDATPSPQLADRIMSAVRRQPPPRVIGIVATLRRRPSLGGVAESVGLAWARVLSTGSVAIRATALAYVALVLVIGVSLSGVTAYSVAGALGWLTLPSRGPDATQLVASPRPLQSPVSTEAEHPEPSDSAEPSETAEPTDGPTDDHEDSGSAGSGAGPSPVHGTDDGSGSGAGHGATPRPTRTPRPSGGPSSSFDD